MSVVKEITPAFLRGHLGKFYWLMSEVKCFISAWICSGSNSTPLTGVPSTNFEIEIPNPVCPEFTT